MPHDMVQIDDRGRPIDRRSGKAGGAVFFYFCIAWSFLLGISGSLSGCDGRARERPLKPCTIALQEWVGYGLFYLADELGYCWEEGLALTFVREELEASRNEAFRMGMLDFDAATVDMLLAKRDRGVAVKAVMALDSSSGADGIVVMPGIDKVEGLAGKKVVLAVGDAGEMFLSYLLHKKGLSLDRVEIVSESPEKVSEAFLAGAGDAAATWEPDLSRCLTRPGSRLLITTKEAPGVMVDVLNVREDLARDDPETVKALMRAWFRALRFYREHPIEASSIIAPYYKMSPESYRKAVSLLEWPDYAQQTGEAYYNALSGVCADLAEIKVKDGKIRATQDIGDVFDRSFLKDLHETRR